MPNPATWFAVVVFVPHTSQKETLNSYTTFVLLLNAPTASGLRQDSPQATHVEPSPLSDVRLPPLVTLKRRSSACGVEPPSWFRSRMISPQSAVPPSVVSAVTSTHR